MMQQMCPGTTNPTMMSNTTPGMTLAGITASPLFWIAVGVLLGLLVGTLLWLFTRWLRQSGLLPVPSTAQPREAYSEEQQAGTLLLHTPSEEDELRAPSSLDERLPGLYPAMTPCNADQGSRKAGAGR